MDIGPLSKLLEALRFKLPADSAGAGKPSGEVRSGNLFGEDEKDLAIKFASQLKISDQSGDIILKSLGLSEVPSDIWQAIGNVQTFDASDNNVCMQENLAFFFCTP